MNAPDPLQTSFAEDLPDPTQSVDLLAQAQNGDQDALSALLDRYQGRLHRIVRVRLGARLRTRVESMDIVQEAYAVAMRKIGDLELRGPGSILNWLARIAEHKIHDANDYFRSREARPGPREGLRRVRLDLGSLRRWGPVRSQRRRSPRGGGAFGVARDHRRRAGRALGRSPRGHLAAGLLRRRLGIRCPERSNAAPPTRPKRLHRRAWIKLRRAVRPRLASLRPTSPDSPSPCGSGRGVP